MRPWPCNSTICKVQKTFAGALYKFRLLCHNRNKKSKNPKMTVCIIHSSGRSRREEALTEIDCTPPEKLASPHVDFYSTGAARSGEKIRVPRRFQWIWPDDGDSGERVRPARRVWRPAKHNPSNLLGVCGPRGDESTGSCQAKKWGARRTPRRPGRSRSPALLDLCRNPLETSRNLFCRPGPPTGRLLSSLIDLPPPL